MIWILLILHIIMACIALGVLARREGDIDALSFVISFFWPFVALFIVGYQIAKKFERKSK